MICEVQAKKYCKDDISKIENYDKAIADKTQTWICHHRLGLTLDGEFAHSHEDLKRLGMYYDRPYFELQFLPLSEHRRLHAMNMNDEARKKLSDANKGRTLSVEHRRKLSAANKGRTSSNKGKKMSSEQKQKISAAHKGKTHGPMSSEQKQKISAANKGKSFSVEHRRKLSAARKAAWSKAKERAEISKGNTPKI